MLRERVRRSVGRGDAEVVNGRHAGSLGQTGRNRKARASRHRVGRDPNAVYGRSGARGVTGPSIAATRLGRAASEGYRHPPPGPDRDVWMPRYHFHIHDGSVDDSVQQRDFNHERPVEYRRFAID